MKDPNEEQEGEEEVKQDSGPMTSEGLLGKRREPSAADPPADDEPHPFDLFEPAGSRIVDALKASPYIGLESLNALTDDEFIAIPGIGRRSINVIRGLLASEGLEPPEFEPIDIDAEPFEIPDDEPKGPRQPPEDWPPPPSTSEATPPAPEEPEEDESPEEPPPPEPEKSEPVPKKTTIRKKVNKTKMRQKKGTKHASYQASANVVFPNWKGEKYNFKIGQSLDDIPADLLEEMKRNGDAKPVKSE